MIHYLFHHGALTTWTNISGWNELIYFEIGFTCSGIGPPIKSKNVYRNFCLISESRKEAKEGEERNLQKRV